MQKNLCSGTQYKLEFWGGRGFLGRVKSRQMQLTNNPTCYTEGKAQGWEAFLKHKAPGTRRWPSQEVHFGNVPSTYGPYPFVKHEITKIIVNINIHKSQSRKSKRVLFTLRLQIHPLSWEGYKVFSNNYTSKFLQVLDEWL